MVFLLASLKTNSLLVIVSFNIHVSHAYVATGLITEKYNFSFAFLEISGFPSGDVVCAIFGKQSDIVTGISAINSGFVAVSIIFTNAAQSTASYYYCFQKDKRVKRGN